LPGEAKHGRRQPAASFVILIGVVVLAGHDSVVVEQAGGDSDMRGRSGGSKFGVLPTLALLATARAHEVKIGRQASGNASENGGKGD
jgi:hypothetical protein